MTLHVMHAVPGMSAPSLGIDHGNGMQLLAMVVSAENLYRCLLLASTQNHASLPVSFQSLRSVLCPTGLLKVIMLRSAGKHVIAVTSVYKLCIGMQCLWRIGIPFTRFDFGMF